MNKHEQFKQFVANNGDKIGKVVYVDPKWHKLMRFDLTGYNHDLSADIVASTYLFSEWLFKTLKANKCKFGIGGYFENRNIYTRSELFNTPQGSRSLHLGVDIWGDAGTVVYAPMKGKVHSFKNNSNFGDYGFTVILEHDLDGLKLYSLYGHLNEEALLGLYEGLILEKGEAIGEIGTPEENGNWPPHLHFQLMFDMQGYSGDYPGACLLSEKDTYLQNIPDPNLVLNFPPQLIIN